MSKHRSDPTEVSGVQVLDRASRLLTALEGKRDGLSVLELSLATRLPRPTVQRIAMSLAAHGLLSSIRGGKRFAIGTRLIHLANSVFVDVLAIAHPLMTELSNEVGETVNLLIREERYAVCIGQARYEQELQVIPKIGTRLALHASASGKALLARMPEPEAKQLLGSSKYKKLTPHTKTRWIDLLPDLDHARSKKLAYDLEESMLGVSAVSCTLEMSAGQVHALTVPMPVHRFHAKRKSVERALLRYRSLLTEAEN